MGNSGKPSAIAVLLILTAGVAAISSSAILIRLALQAAAQKGLGISLLIAATRLSIATLLLLPIAYVRKEKNSRGSRSTAASIASTIPKSAKLAPEHEYSSQQNSPLTTTDAANLPDLSTATGDAINSPDLLPKSQSISQPATIALAKKQQLPTSALLLAIASGILLAGHFFTWTTSLSYTSIAASTTLVTTNPLWTALIGWLWYKERLSPLTWLGIAIALIGGVLIAQADSGQTIGSNPALGNVLALLGAIAMSLYLHLAQRAQQQGLSLNTHITIAYGSAALVLLPLPLLTQTYYWQLPPQFYGYTLLMAIAPQLIGHTSLNWSLRWTSPTIVAMAILCEPVLASLFGYVFLAETVARLTIVGTSLILAGVATTIVSMWKR
jgi:drug/metabolite transporter (DMT)-like permease